MLDRTVVVAFEINEFSYTHFFAHCNKRDMHPNTVMNLILFDFNDMCKKCEQQGINVRKEIGYDDDEKAD